MTRDTDRPTAGASAPPRPLAGLEGKIVCPFCGTVRETETNQSGETPCPRCTMADTPATRKATQARLGPWFIRQNRNPAAPGMTFDTLLTLIRRGQVTAFSVLRGPTTQQMWRFAAQVRGVSREFGLCHACGHEIDKSATTCSQCGRNQQPPANVDALVDTGATPPIQKEIPPTAREPEPQREPEPKPQADPEPAPRSASPAPARENASPGASAKKRPDAPPAPGRVPHKRSEEILSARDLAAAFQLQMDPAADRPITPPAPRRRGRLVLVVLLLVAIGGAAAMVLRPDWRDQAGAWSGNAIESAKALSRSTMAKLDGDPAPQPEPALPGLDAPLPEPESVAIAPPVEPAPMDTTPDVAPAPQTTETSPARQLDEPITSAEPTEPAPAPAPAGDGDSFVVPQDPALIFDTARVLWREALDAEARGDYARAIRTYEQIKQLPPEAWPAGLETNLRFARQRAR